MSSVEDRRVLVCLGGGGVGKTTLAAAWGVAGALAGRRVVVLTVDPAQRLASALGLDGEPASGSGSGSANDPASGSANDPASGSANDPASGSANDPGNGGESEPSPAGDPGDERGGAGRGLGQGQAIGNEPVLVEGPWPGELWASMLDPVATLATLITEHGSPDQAARLAGNPLLSSIVGSMSGAGEYLAAERLYQLDHDPRFDEVVIDTPPSRHALDFLDSPHRLVRFIDNRFYRALFRPRRGVLRSLSAATQLALRLAAKLVGSDLVDNVIRLFEDLGSLDEGFRRRATATADLLSSDRCRYALITSPRVEPLREARWIHEGLARRGHELDIVVVNRRLPIHHPTPGGGGRADTQPPANAPAALVENWRQLALLAAREDALTADLVDRLPAGPGARGGAGVTVAVLDERPEPVTDLAHLSDLARSLVAAEERAEATAPGTDPTSDPT